MAVFVVHPVQVIDGVHRVELDLCEVFVTDPVELRGGMGGRRPRHGVSSDGGPTGSMCAVQFRVPTNGYFTVLIKTGCRFAPS